MSKAVQITRNGGPEVLDLVDVYVGKPGKGEVKIRQSAIGLNFIDIYFRSGLYKATNGFPLILGSEAAGSVVEVGQDVYDLKVGDRVAYVLPNGAYAEERLAPAEKLVKLVDGVSDENAAGAMLKGLTVEYLVRRTYAIQPGDTVLFHAAAGGVGLMFGQWAKHLGATVIGTASSPEKIELAKAHGFDHVINYSQDDFVDAVKDITGGKLCSAAYDSVGKDTFMKSLDCLRPRGMMVSFGQSSGSVPPFDLGILSQKGSLFLTRPTLFGYIATRRELLDASAALFDVISKGIVKVEINQRYPLADAGMAHADLESRRTTGVTLLHP